MIEISYLIKHLCCCDNLIISPNNNIDSFTFSYAMLFTLEENALVLLVLDMNRSLGNLLDGQILYIF